MTKIAFLSDAAGICGFEVAGHSTENCDDLEGKLVCSAVSSAAYMAANTVTEIIGDKCDAEVSDGMMKIRVANPSKASRAVLEGFRLHISELSKQYSKRLKITEV